MAAIFTGGSVGGGRGLWSDLLTVVTRGRRSATVACEGRRQYRGMKVEKNNMTRIRWCHHVRFSIAYEPAISRHPICTSGDPKRGLDPMVGKHWRSG